MGYTLGPPVGTLPAPQDAGSTPVAGYVLGPPTPPSTVDVLKSIPTVVRSNLQSFVGGAVQSAGDIANKIYADAGERLVESGRGIQESARRNIAADVPPNLTLGQEILTSGVASAAETLPLLALGPVRAPLAMGAMTAGRSYGETREAGFGPGRSAVHAIFEGAAEWGPERLTAKALFGTHQNLLAKFMAVLSREIPGELLTTSLQSASAKLSRNPEMTAKEFMHDLAVTAGATTLGVPLQAGAVHGVQRLAGRLMGPPKNITPTIGENSNNKLPPQYGNLFAEALELAGFDTTDPNYAGLNLPPTGASRATAGVPGAIPITAGQPVAATLPAGATQPVPAVQGQTVSPANADAERFLKVKTAMQAGTPVLPGDWAWSQWYERNHTTPASQGQEAQQGQTAAVPTVPIQPVTIPAPGTATNAEVAKVAGGVPDAPPPFAPAAAPATSTNAELPKIYGITGSGERSIVYVRNDQDGTYSILGVMTGPKHGNVGEYRVAETGRLTAEKLREMFPQHAGQMIAVADSYPGQVIETQGVPIDRKWATNRALYDKLSSAWADHDRKGVAMDNLPKRLSVPAITPTTPSPQMQDTKQVYRTSQKVETGKTWKESTTPERGEVVAFVTEDDAEKHVRSYVKLLKHWMAKYLPDARINIVAGSTDANTGGFMTMNSDGSYNIWVNPRDALHGWVSLAHEFGHVLIAEEFHKASAAVRNSLFEQYHSFLLRVQRGMTLQEFALERHTPDYAEWVVRRHGPDMPASEFIAIQDELVDTEGYTLSFDEYLADQFAKYVTERGKYDFGDNAVVVFLRDTFEKLYAFWKGLPVGFRGGAGDSFAKWVQDMANTHRPNVSVLQQQTLPGGKLPSGEAKSPASDDRPTGFAAIPQNIAERFERLGHPALSQAHTKFNWLLGRFASVLQIAKRNKHIPGVQQFVEGLRRGFATKSHWTSQANSVLEDWKEIGKEQADKLAQLLLEETNQSRFLSTVSVDPTDARKRIYTLDTKTIERLGLKPETVALYQRVHGMYLEALNEMEINGVEELWRIYDPDTYYATYNREGSGRSLLYAPPTHPALAGHIAAQTKDYEKLREAPYMPYTRFGRYAVLVKADQQTKWRNRDFNAGETAYFAAFDTADERNKHLLEMKKQLEFMPLTASGVNIKDEPYNARGLPPNVLEILQARLKLDPAQVKEFRDIMAGMSSSRAFVKHMQKREGVFGYSEDVQRVFGDYFLRYANYISRLKHGHELDHALDELAKSSKAISDAGGVSGKRDDLHQWLYELREYVMKPKNELEDLRAVLTVAYLMYNVKSAVINSFQVPFVTIPYLSKRYGWNDAFQSVMKSYKDNATSWKKPENMSEEEWEAVQKGISEGFLNESFAATLANVAEGGNLVRALPVTRLGKGWEHVKTHGMALFQRVEEINRRVAFLAAYRLAREKGMTPPAAYKEARTTVEDTQGEYAQWDRPEFMRGKAKSLMFMFMKYQQNMIFQMYGGDKAWMRLLGTHLALAGLMGLPFVGNVDDFLKWFSKQFGLNTNLETEARKMLSDIDVNPDWLLSGMSHNFFGVDLSGSLSMGRVMPGTEMLSQEGDFASRMLAGTRDISGAGVSFLINILQAVSDTNPNTFMRFQRAMPSALQNLMKSAEIVEHGGRLDKTGAVAAAASNGDAFLQALGFNPSQVSSELKEFHAKKQLVMYWQTRRRVLMDQYWYAGHVITDREGLADVKSAISKFNSETPDKKLNITPDDLSRSVKARKRAKLMREKGLTPQKRMADVLQQVERMYMTDEQS